MSNGQEDWLIAQHYINISGWKSFPNDCSVPTELFHLQHFSAFFSSKCGSTCRIASFTEVNSVITSILDKVGGKIRTGTKNSNLIFIRICKDAQYVLYACVHTIFCNLNILLLCCSLWLRNPTLLFYFIISDTSQQLFEVASCSTLQQDLCSSQDWYWVWFFVK